MPCMTVASLEMSDEPLNDVRIASPTVTKQTIMQTPFQNFNPVSEGGKPLPNLKE